MILLDKLSSKDTEYTEVQKGNTLGLTLLRPCRVDQLILLSQSPNETQIQNIQFIKVYLYTGMLILQIFQTLKRLSDMMK